MTARPNIISIAGFDPSCGAGVVADCKTAEALNCYAHAVLTANTFQNQNSFESIEWFDTSKIIKQIEIILKKNSFTIAKIGLIKDCIQLADIVDYLKSKNIKIIIWDPILKASAGFKFHNNAINKDAKIVMQRIQLIMPNRNEAEILWGTQQAEAIQQQLADKECAVLLKGGHAEMERGTDYLITHQYIERIKTNHIFDSPKHGSGCVLSSAVACELAKGLSLAESCRNAKKYIEQFLQSNNSLLGYHS